MTVVLLLFLIRAAFTTPSIYFVSHYSSDSYIYTGVYEEKREPELHYKKLGEPDWRGDYWFLYTDSRRPQTWIIGFGKTFSTVQARYRAPARAGRPAVTQWSYVHDGSREGEEKGSSDYEPFVRVVGVERRNITGEELAEQLEGGEDIVTEEYIICNSTEQSKPRLIISKCSDDPLHCDGVHNCESGADEHCSDSTICDYSKRVQLTRSQWEAGLDIKDDQGNLVCKSPKDRLVTISKDDPRFCDGVPDCNTKSDELCPYVTIHDRSVKVNITREEYEAGGGIRV